MAKVVSLSLPAYELLRKMKKPGQSYSDVVLEYLKPTPSTCAELIEDLEKNFEGVPITTIERLNALRAGRGRRSNRKARK